MTSDKPQLDPIERALLELRDVDRCRVEARTPIDESVLRQPISVAGGSSVGHLFRWSRVAAVLGIAAVSWGVMFSFEITSLQTKSKNQQATGNLALSRTPGHSPLHAPAPTDATSKHFDHCNGAFVSNFTGPAAGMKSSPSFHDYDYDGDGDVDLADFQKFQLSCTGPA